MVRSTAAFLHPNPHHLDRYVPLVSTTLDHSVRPGKPPLYATCGLVAERGGRDLVNVARHTVVGASEPQYAAGPSAPLPTHAYRDTTRAWPILWILQTARTTKITPPSFSILRLLLLPI
ncbi:hypothetical protein C8Q77DRAFT_779108 [Trametes polyzona]|nr:hypothetical protein C8Q77DRAFT_779108 [Trametes polyzona]